MSWGEVFRVSPTRSFPSTGEVCTACCGVAAGTWLCDSDALGMVALCPVTQVTASTELSRREVPSPGSCTVRDRKCRLPGASASGPLEQSVLGVSTRVGRPQGGTPPSPGTESAQEEAPARWRWRHPATDPVSPKTKLRSAPVCSRFASAAPWPPATQGSLPVEMGAARERPGDSRPAGLGAGAPHGSEGEAWGGRGVGPYVGPAVVETGPKRASVRSPDPSSAPGVGEAGVCLLGRSRAQRTSLRRQTECQRQPSWWCRADRAAGRVRAGCVTAAPIDTVERHGTPLTSAAEVTGILGISKGHDGKAGEDHVIVT